MWHPWSGNLIPFDNDMSWKLKYFGACQKMLFFFCNRKSHCGGLVLEFSFIPYTHTHRVKPQFHNLKVSNAGTRITLTLILPRSRTGMVWFYTSTSNKRAARPKLYTKSLTRDLKLMYSHLTLVRISINLNSSQLNMFREIILPIFRSTRLCVQLVV